MNNLKNTYFVLRHGKSKANQLKILNTNPKEGTRDFGLTDKGRLEVKKSVDKVKENGFLDKKTIIVSSDFLRTRETAKIAAEVLKVDKVILSKKLRERNFGDWDKTSVLNYVKVWRRDFVNPDQKENNVESVNEVLMRTTSLIRELEKKYKGRKILLVSHGDPIQILTSAFKNVPASKHSLLNYPKTGSLKRLN